MSGLPRKMKSAAESLVCFVLCLGCAQCATNPRTQMERATLFGPHTVASSDGTIEATVYGDLLDRSAAVPQKTDWLTEFLYGPAMPPRRLLRTPQGLTSLGGTIFVCDQGVPDVFRVDFVHDGVVSPIRFSDRPVCPVSIAAGPEGSLYVADTTRRAVLSYDSTGNIVEMLSPTDGNDGFIPTSVLVYGSTLFVADRGGRRIARYDFPSREWLSSWSPSSDSPLGAPTGLAMSEDEVLLISDALGGVIHRVDREGRWQTPMGRRGRAVGELIRPMGLCCTRSGLILVADAAKQAVVVFDRDGRELMDIGGADGDWRWTLPCGIAWLAEFEPQGLKGLDEIAAPDSREWIVVSDMLGGGGLTLIGIDQKRMPEDGALATGAHE